MAQLKNFKTPADLVIHYTLNAVKSIPNKERNAFEEMLFNQIKRSREDESVMKDVAEKGLNLTEVKPTSSNRNDHVGLLLAKSIKTKCSTYSIIGNKLHMVLRKEVLEPFNGLIETNRMLYGDKPLQPSFDVNADFHLEVARENCDDMEDYMLGLMKQSRRMQMIFVGAYMDGIRSKIWKSKLGPDKSINVFGNDFGEEDIKDPSLVLNQLKDEQGFPAIIVLKGVALDKLTSTPGIDKYVVKNEKGEAASSAICVLPKVGFVQALIDVKKFKLSGGGTDSNAHFFEDVSEKEIIVEESKLSEGGSEDNAQSGAAVSEEENIDVEKLKLSAGGSEDNAQSGAENLVEDYLMYVGLDLNLLKELFKSAL